MHILVLGGAGAMGRVAVRALTAYSDVDLVTIADHNEQRAHDVAAAVDSLDVVDGIKLKLVSRDTTRSSPPLLPPFFIHPILDKFTKQPQVSKEGECYPQQPLRGQKEMVFPLPVGGATAFYSLH